MRRLFLLLISVFFASALFVHIPKVAYAGYTCCDTTGTISPQDYALHCNTCDTSGKEWKNAGDSCGGKPTSQCETCGGGRPYGNACGGTPVQGTCQFYPAGPFVFPADGKYHTVRVPLGAAGLPDRVDFKKSVLFPFRIYPPYVFLRDAQGYYNTGALSTVPGSYTFTAQGTYNCGGHNDYCPNAQVHCSRVYNIEFTPPSPTPTPTATI